MFITIGLVTMGIVVAAVLLGWIVNAIAEFMSDVFDVFLTGIKAAAFLGVAVTLAVFITSYCL